MIAYVVKNKSKRRDIENVNILPEEKTSDVYAAQNPIFDVHVVN